MSRPQQGLVGVVCALGLLSATCATRTAPPAPLPFPEPVAATDARVPYVPGPTRIDDGPTGPPEVRGGATAAAEGGDLTVADAPSASSVDGTTSPDVELPERDVDQLPDLEIPMNAKVTTFVDLFSRRLKGDLEDGLGRGAQYLPMIREVFRAEGLPLDLAYVPLIESAFKPSALSRARAKGIWQFMEGTALENGLQSDWYIDERAEPEKATRAAAKYLRTLYGMFDDWHLALAAYNGGPGRVRRAMRSSGRADFWSLSESTRYLPRETRDYVPLILASVVVARDPAAYDIAVVPEKAPPVEAIHVAGAVDLRRVAAWADTPLETLQELNPELRRWTTPVLAAEYELKLPLGTADLVLERMTLANPEELASLAWYSVAKGDTLIGVARHLGVTRSDLAQANFLSIRAKLQIGQQLIVPRAPSLDQPIGSGPAMTLARINATPDEMVHVVERGDTLYALARLYGTTVRALQTWNRIAGSAIQVGQRLTLFPNGTAGVN